MNGERPSRWQSPWLWIGLSCGVLSLGVAGLIAIFSYVTYRSVERVRDEPVLTVATMLAQRDPDVTVASRDEEARTVTLRNRRTGERFVLGQRGKDRLRIKTEAGEVIPHFSGAGGLRPGRGQEGKLRLGSAAGPLPAWVPAYPDMKLHPLYALSAGGVESGCAKVTSAAPVEDVFRRYRVELARRDFKVVPAAEGVSASSPDFRLSIFLTPAAGSPPGALLTWSELAGNR